MQDSKYEFTYTECNKMSKVHAQVSRIYGLFWLTNQMWFSVVCAPIDNDMCHHSGQNVVNSRNYMITKLHPGPT